MECWGWGGSRYIPGEERLLEPSADDEDIPGFVGEGFDWEWRGHGDLQVMRYGVC